MRHYILTRSSFGPSVPLSENRHRLKLLRRVTAPSLRAQTNKDLAWLVLVDPNDPLLRERRRAIESSGLRVVIKSSEKMVVRGGMDKPYGPWKKHLLFTRPPILTTRLDDDDAFAPWAMEAIRVKAEKWERTVNERVVFTFPGGWRVAGPLAERVRWTIPMFSTLFAPAADETTIMDANHLGAAKLAPLEPVTDRPAWLWVRHATTRSSYVGHMEGWREKAALITDELRDAFPVDWPLIESLEEK